MVILLAAAHAEPWACGTADARGRPPLRFTAAAPPPAGGLTSCIDPQAAAEDRDAAGTLSARRQTEHFDIAYDPDDDIVSEERIDTLADALETAWDGEIEQLGWPAPEGSDTHYVQVVVANFSLDAQFGGIASTAVCDGQNVGYLLLNTDFWYRSSDYLRDIPAHELNHLSQYASGAEFGDDDSEWLYEATAVWMEDRAFPESDSWANEFLSAYLADPGTGLTDFVYATGPQYGHFVYDRYLDEHVGGNELVREVWTSAKRTEGATDALDRVLDEADGGGVAEHWGGFLAHMAGFDYTDRDLFVSTWESGGDGYYEVDGEVPGGADGVGRPDRLGAAFLHLRAPEGHGVSFTFTGEADEGWAVGGWDGTNVVSVMADGGVATIDLPGSEVWIGVGPTAKGASAWSWEAEATDPPVVEEEDRTCGCAAGTGGRAPLSLGLGLLVWAGARGRPGACYLPADVRPGRLRRLQARLLRRWLHGHGRASGE